MTLGLRTFASPVELAKYIAEQVDRARHHLGDRLRQLDDIRYAVERGRKTQETLLKLVGGKKNNEKSVSRDLSGIELTINPTPEQELTIVEQIVDSLQMKASALERAQKALEPLLLLEADRAAPRVAVLLEQGIPVRVTIYTTTRSALLNLEQGGLEEITVDLVKARVPERPPP